jgi:protein-disulfide isomerase
LDRGQNLCQNTGAISGGESPVSRKTLFIVLSLVVLIAAAGIGYTVMGGSGDAATTNGQGYQILPSDRTLGNPKSKVVLIEYAAPSCPVCAAFNVQSFPQLKAHYIDTGKIFYVFRVFPLRSDDGSAEKIARCLPEDKYFAFIDLLFKNQPKWDVEYGVPAPEGVHDGLVLLGRIAGMSREQVDQCMVNKAEDDRINTVSSDAQARYSVNATPTFILNGVSIGSGNIPFETMSKLLDTELAKQH